MSEIEKIGEIVKARSTDLQRAAVDLVERGLSDIARLEADPRLLGLIEILKNSKDWNERVGAWQKIQEMGPGAAGWTEALRSLIYSGDGWGRIFAAETLSWHGFCESDAVPVLVATLWSTLELRQYQWARMACGALGKYKGLSRPLVELALPALIDALDADDINVQLYAALALGSWGKASQAALVKLAGLFERADEPFKAGFLESLQKIAPSVKTGLDALIVALNHPEPSIRAAAAQAVSVRGRGAAEALPHLLSLFRDESPDVRKYVAISLGNIQEVGDETLVKLKVLAVDDDPLVRLASSYALVKLGVDPKYHVTRLCEGLRGDEEHRLLSARALGEVGGASPWRSAHALEKALQVEKSERIRKAMGDALDSLNG